MRPSCSEWRVEAAQRGDEVLAGAATAAGVAASDDVVLDVFDELLDLRRGRVVESPVGPVVEDAVPVGAVDAPGAVADGCGHDGDVLGEGRHGWPGGCGVEQVAGGEAHAGQEQAGGVEVGRAGRDGRLRGVHAGPPDEAGLLPARSASSAVAV